MKRTNRLFRSLRAILAVSATAVLIAVTGCGANGRKHTAGNEPSVRTTQEWTFTVAKGAVTIVALPPPPGVTRDAVKIARRDPSLKRLLAGSPPHVLQSGNWTSVSDGKRLGANLIVRLPHAIEVDADLPYVEIPPDTPAGEACQHPYAQGWIHERSAGVVELAVLVDVHRKAVVAINTDARSGIRSWVPRLPHPRCAR